MKFKVGDRVRVKSKKWYDTNNVSGTVCGKEAGCDFIDEMVNTCGTVLFIKYVEQGHYLVDENNYLWHDFMLEDELVPDIPMWPTAEDTQKVKEAADKLLAIQAEKASTLPLYLGTTNDLVNDPVNHPEHYTSNGMQCWDAIKASMTREAFCGYLKGNVQKYIWRYEKKIAPVEDLRKAAVYLNKLIEELNDNTPNS